MVLRTIDSALGFGVVAVTMLLSCAGEEKKQQRADQTASPAVTISPNPSGQDQPSTPDSGGANNGTDGRGGAITPKIEAQVYRATLGDSFTYIEKTKGWTDRDPNEIPYWLTDVKSSSRVTKVYAAEKSDKYRRNVKLIFDNKSNQPGNTNDEGSNIDVGVADAGASCGESKCQESDAGTKDFGIFTGAKGKKQVCDVVSCKTPSGNAGATTKSVSRTETITYTHPKALHENFVVKVVTKSCSTILPGETDVASFDVCAVDATRRTSFTKSDFEIVEQTAGQGGGPVSSSYPRGNFKYTVR